MAQNAQVESIGTKVKTQVCISPSLSSQQEKRTRLSFYLEFCNTF